MNVNYFFWNNLRTYTERERDTHAHGGVDDIETSAKMIKKNENKNYYLKLECDDIHVD